MKGWAQGAGPNARMAQQGMGPSVWGRCVMPSCLCVCMLGCLTRPHAWVGCQNQHACMHTEYICKQASWAHGVIKHNGSVCTRVCSCLL